MSDVPVPAPRLESSVTRIAKISAMTHMPIANCAARRRRAKSEMRTAMMPQATVAANIAIYGRIPWWTK